MRLRTWCMQFKKITSQAFFPPFYLYRVSGSSMEPVINEGDVVFVIDKYLSRPKTGAIVLFIKNDRIMIKRIKKVKLNEYDVEGDNTSQSTDSRDFGPIKKSEIIGSVVKIFHVNR